MSESTLSIGVLLPEILGTYGDTGNAHVLAERAIRRGIDARVYLVGLGDDIPAELDIYTLGGGEDTAQMLAAEKLRTDPGLVRALDAGRPLLAICASMQVLGHWYCDARGQQVAGLGALDVTTTAGSSRAIGELVTHPLVDGLTEKLTGFENHGGRTILGVDARPLGRVLAGIGNCEAAVDDQDGRCGVDGAVQGSIIATYLHGPVLARNPELADLILSRATGATMDPLEVPAVSQLRRERLAAAGC